MFEGKAVVMEQFYLLVDQDKKKKCRFWIVQVIENTGLAVATVCYETDCPLLLLCK